MPIYEFRCEKCGRIYEQYFKVSSVDSIIPCTCGENMHKIFSTYKVIGDDGFKPYFDNGLGIQVNSRKDVARFLKMKKEEGVSIEPVG